MEIRQELESLGEVVRELEAIFNSSYDEIFVTDGEGITLRVNEAGLRYYGVKADEIVGKHVSELEEQGFFSPSVTPMVIKERKRVTSIQTTKAGQTLIVTANPVFDKQGNIIRIVTNSRDITELTSLRQRLEDVEKLKDIYRTEIAKLRRERLGAAEIISASSIMEHVLDVAEKVANVNSTVFVQGESGVGKGIIAFRIHQLSKRKAGPFITINCGAIPENLMESELFGYEGGAFTGAKKGGKKGLIELAQGGTIFFDEVGELPLSLQVKLLSVIQDKKLMRVGGNNYIDIDIRIIVATNKNIQELVKENKFREDLFYRLNVVPITVPPLRYRKEDICLLVDCFVSRFCEKYELQKSFLDETKEVLTKYSWPGNVRELENVVERLLVTVDSTEILPGHLPEYILHTDGGNERVFVTEICTLKSAVEEVERQLLKKALAKYKNTYRMAEALGVNQSTVVRKLQQHQIIKDKGEEK
ncbi:MAG: sigma 54-interacting transcriptional regulator [Clostridia bacterium]|nr:sigma 54-interacting transcriptional regulator [Clostridia bacterium]